MKLSADYLAAIRNKERSSMHYRNVWSEVPPALPIPTPSRFGRAIGKYTVMVTEACNDCLKCVAVCPEKVLKFRVAGFFPPRSSLSGN